MGMTVKQRAFVENYSGNATAAAIAAGYSPKTAYSMGQRLLKNVEISKAIQERETARLTPEIATRERRLQFWTRVMDDPKADMKNRLRASELLGKAEGDFLDRVEHSGEAPLDVTAQIRMVLLEREKARREAEREAEKAERARALADA